MTWAEFRIRLFAHQRMQRNELYKVREICYQIYVSNYYGKGKPVSKERYWPIDKKKPIDVERIKNVMKKAYLKYNQEKNE